MPEVIRGRRTDGKVLITADTVLIESGDLLFYTAATNEVEPFSSQADQGSEPLNQQLAARLFLGVSEDRSPAGVTTAITVNVNPLTEYSFDCPSATYDLGSLVGPSEDVAATGLLDQTVEAVTNLSEAIGVVTQDEAAAVTTVRVRLFSRLVGELGLTGAAGPNVGVNVQTLAAGLTLTANSPGHQILDPGGAARVVTLPAEAEGLQFAIQNAASADETLTIDNDAAAAQVYLRQGESATLTSDGTSWFVSGQGFTGAPPVVASSPGATVSLDDLDVPVQRITTGAGTVLELPAEAATNRPFLLAHVAGAHTLRVDDDAANVIITDIANGENGRVWSDGTNWYGETFQIT